MDGAVETALTGRHLNLGGITVGTFVRVWGRSRIYDRLKQGIKSCSPRWFISAMQAAMRPYVSLRVGLDRRRKIAAALPVELHRSFNGMLREARSRWNRGEHSTTGEPLDLPVPGSRYRVHIRPGTCDVMLFYDIFIQEHYGRARVSNVKNVIDCGANIGLASAFFLSRYPECRVVALEPDPVNHELCRRNLAQFGDRVTLLRMGLWGSCRKLAVASVNVGTWASTVAPIEGAGDTNAIDGIDMASLMDRVGMETVDILKVDIEGAELPVFTAADVSWMDRVRCFQIEPENAICRQAFLDAFGGLSSSYGFVQHREILIAER